MWSTAWLALSKSEGQQLPLLLAHQRVFVLLQVG
jgi:hypothetical protein